MKFNQNLTIVEINEIIEMAWVDLVPFDAIEKSFGLKEQAVIQLMRHQLKRSSFQLWRKRVSGRKSKHQQRCNNNN